MTDATAVPAVVYAAKSTEDTHGSIPTQIEDARALAERNGWEVVGVYQDEAKSAYKGNRGDDLARAREHAERVGGVIVVQHSDRLARGDGIRADHLVELVLWARKTGVRWASVQDPQTFDGMGLVYAALMGDRNHDDSARKSESVRSGIKRRAEKGKPVGSMPLGYTVEKVVTDGNVVTRRVVAKDAATTVRSIFDRVEHGASPGAIARDLNVAGVTTKRGKPWDARAVRRIAENPVFAGHSGYPAIVSREQAERTCQAINRLDPAAVQRRKGGRSPGDGSFFLRGIARCLVCDSALWTRRNAENGKRFYVCRHRRQGTGVCDAEPIPATLIEEHVLGHLTAFVGDAQTWALQQVHEMEEDRTARQRAVNRLKAESAELDRRRGLVLADYTDAVTEGDTKARIVLEAIDRLDGQGTKLARRIADAEAQLREWTEATDDEALDLIQGLLDLVQGKVANAEGAAAVHEALASVLAGIWARFDGDRLRAEFRMADIAGPSEAGRQGFVYLLAHTHPVGVSAERVTFGPSQPRHTPRSTAA